MNNGIQLESLIKGALIYAEDKINPSDASLEKAKIILEIDKRYRNRVLRNPILKETTFVWFMVFAFIFVMTGGAIGASAVTLLKTDNTGKIDKNNIGDMNGKAIKTDYSFVDDPQVIGKWESVDYVNSIDEFSPDKKLWTDRLFLKEQVFLKDGKMLISTVEGNGHLSSSPTTWTKDLIISKIDETASKYKIMDINGSTYMFMECKTGDYIFGGMQPKLYVLRKVDDVDYSKADIPRRTDETDYPFVNDPQVKGTWESVDLVSTIEGFNPGARSWRTDLLVTSLVFEGKGKMTMKTMKGDDTADRTWTNGLIICKLAQTASKYEIKEMNGSTYLFFEWKSGDYVYRGIRPYFYVLKKVD